MEVPLTPLEFMRRTRTLYADREARGRRRAALDLRRSSSIAATVGRRRCSALGVEQGDRVAYIAPNTHAQLESFYAVPQIGAVLVPINFRLDRRRFPLHHQTQRRDGGLRARRIISTAVDVDPRRADGRSRISSRSTGAGRDGWLDYEALLAGAHADFDRPRDRRERSADASTTRAAPRRGRRA